MRLPFWTSTESTDDNKSASSALTSSSESYSTSNTSRSPTSQTLAANISQFSPVQTITACVGTTVGALGALTLYKRYIRRIPNVGFLTPSILRNRSLYGFVTRVGDGDNFHLFHTPGGRLAGWGWLRRAHLSKDKKSFKNKTVHVRIAGIDAPELSHFGRPAQPYSQEALDWLTARVLHRYVRARPYRRDQYDRVVCSVQLRKWLFFKTDLGLEMLKAGYATVYEAKAGSEFGNMEEEYRAAEERAKQKKMGMWHEPSLVGKFFGQKTALESPRQYKDRMAKEQMAK